MELSSLLHGNPIMWFEGKMKKLILLTIAMAILAGVGNSGHATTIDFDDIVGMAAGSSRAGQVILPEFMVDDEYLSLGVLFYTEGGGLRVTRAGNSISYPNLVAGTARGARLDYNAMVRASFWVDDVPGLVDMAGLTISNFDGAGKLEAYTLDGELLGAVFDKGVSILSLTYPGQIHSVVFKPTHAVFDNFTFDGLRMVPIPGAAWLLGSGFFGLFCIRQLFKK